MQPECRHGSWTPATLDVARALSAGRASGFRNSQVTLLAPTGTIGFMMDCDTTGVEPAIALVKYKKLVDGGLMKIVNNSVPDALERLGYSEDEVKAIAANYTYAGDPDEFGDPTTREGPTRAGDCPSRQLPQQATAPAGKGSTASAPTSCCTSTASRSAFWS